MAYKNIWHHQLNTSLALVLCSYTTVCTISKDIGINKEKEIILPNNQYISGHRCERTTMVAKCEMFMNCSKDSQAFAGNKCNDQKRNT